MKLTSLPTLLTAGSLLLAVAACTDHVFPPAGFPLFAEASEPKLLSTAPNGTAIYNGGFGSALRTWPHAIAAVMAAKKLGRPVKVVLTRPQMFFLVGYRPEARTGLLQISPYSACLPGNGQGRRKAVPDRPPATWRVSVVYTTRPFLSSHGVSKCLGEVGTRAARPKEQG